MFMKLKVEIQNNVVMHLVTYQVKGGQTNSCLWSKRLKYKKNVFIVIYQYQSMFKNMKSQCLWMDLVCKCVILQDVFRPVTNFGEIMIMKQQDIMITDQPNIKQ